MPNHIKALCLFSLILLSLFAYSVYSENEKHIVGARSVALGYVTLAPNDFWSIHNHPARMTLIDQLVTGVYCENHYLLKELNYGIYGLAIPTNSGVLGFDLSHYGYSLYSENTIGIGFAKKMFPFFSVGIKLNYNQISLGENYGKKDFVCFEIGVSTKVSSKIEIAAHIYNPENIKANSTFLNIPTTFNFGGVYTIYKSTSLIAEYEKSFTQKPKLKCGLEHQVFQNIFIRTGLATQPFVQTLGIGYCYKRLSIDFANSFHPQLGCSPCFSLTCQF